MTANEILIVTGLLLCLLLTGSVIYIGVQPTLNTLWVRKHGTRITATVVDTQTDHYIIGKDNAYYLLARWEDSTTHQVYTFKSEPGRAILLKNHPPGSPVEVLIDPRHPKRYEMVLQFNEYSYRGYANYEEQEGL